MVGLTLFVVLRGNSTLNLGKPTNSNNFVTVVVRFSELVLRHFTQEHLLTTLKNNSNIAIDSTKLRLNVDKFTNSNTFLAVIGRL